MTECVVVLGDRQDPQVTLALVAALGQVGLQARVLVDSRVLERAQQVADEQMLAWMGDAPPVVTINRAQPVYGHSARRPKRDKYPGAALREINARKGVG